MRWMNRLATTLIVLAVVAGPPLFAASWLINHPWKTPTRAQFDTWAEQPLTPATIITGFVIIAVLTWLLLITYLTRRAWAGLRRRLHRLRHLPVPTPAQMTAGSMAGLAAFTLPALPSTHPQPPPAATGVAHPLDPGTTELHSEQSTQDQPAGITLPGGGWIPYRTAAAISALATLSWLQTRRHYRPDPRHPRTHDTDPDLQPASDTVHTVTTALTDDPPPHVEPPTPPVQHLPDGVLLLTGPGATAAARGLLVSAAIAAAGGTPTVSIDPDDLHTLLPTTDLTNSAFTAPKPASRPPTGRSPLPGGPRDDQSEPCRRRATPGARPDPRTSTVIVLDDERAATHHWHITADGSATGTGLTGTRRLGTLNQQTAEDLLTLIRRPATSDASPQPSQHLTQPAATTPHPPTAATVVLLGRCELSAAGQPVPIRRTAGLQILAYLAIHPHGATRSELTHAIWPQLPTATISQRLHTTLADLRQQLRPLLDDDPISRHDDRYRLNAHSVTTDLRQWRTAAHAMTHAVGTAAQHRACQHVVELYTGELAAGRNWSWLTPDREQTRRTVIDACATLATLTDTDQALTWLRRAITIDPYNEPLHQQAAGLLHATGDQTGAADLMKRLHNRLDLETQNAP